jgi:cyanophycin synthetase
MNGQMITIYERGAHIPLLWTHLIPATVEGRALHNVQNAMFAAAIAFSLKVKLEDIRHGLRTFDTTFFQAPGRMNIFDGHPFKVILDYGHNPAAVNAMVQLVQRLEPKGRKLLVLAAPGDRRDEDIREIARLCAGPFDHVICRRDDNPRGRGDDEVPRLLRDTLIEHGMQPARIEIIPTEPEALARALSLARRDDLLLVFGDKPGRCWKQITGFQADMTQAPEAHAPAPPPVSMEPAPALAHSLGGETLVRDERGVRLARELDD